MKKLLSILMFAPLFSFSQTAEIYENNEYGVPVKVSEIKEGSNGELNVYRLNNYGLPEKTETLSPSNNGGYDVSKINKSGIPEKTGEVRFTPSVTPSLTPSRR
jgi:hypothetical protein